MCIGGAVFYHNVNSDGGVNDVHIVNHAEIHSNNYTSCHISCENYCEQLDFENCMTNIGGNPYECLSCSNCTELRYCLEEDVDWYCTCERSR